MSTPSASPHAPSANPRCLKSLVEPILPKTERIRNVCILAHVDHGKTTLTDSLLASNGIISFKQAGSLRYLDSREDEQERGITMESSAISLLYDYIAQFGNDSQDNVLMQSLSVGDRRFLINLIDSPGHVDFLSQVVTASRLCDGCLVLVDAVEGVCTQTAAVLRQAHREALKPCLVINKIDRLITELQLTTENATKWLQKLLEQVNAIYSTITKGSGGNDNDNDGGEEETVGMDMQFSPREGNVCFASATDGWAFNVDQFANFYSKKLNMKKETLRQTLWGEYYYDEKNQRVITLKSAQKSGLSKSMFAQFILDQIWAVYDATVTNWNLPKVEKISQVLNLKPPSRELKNRDGRGLLKSLLSQWLPLANCAFEMIIRHLPDPITANKTRMKKLFPSLDYQFENDSVAYVSKLISISRPIFSNDKNAAETEEFFVGMSRMFYGSLQVGQSIHVLNPKHTAQNPSYETMTISKLYLLMGREIEECNQVYAGNVFGLGGVKNVIWKSATLALSPTCPSFDRMDSDVAPLVQVAIRPKEIGNMSKLVNGLRMLCQADPCAETFIQSENGEHILSTAGELHLEQCLKDLVEKFAKVEINVTSPMVPFRETIANKLCSNNPIAEDSDSSSDNDSDNDSYINNDHPPPPREEKGVIQAYTADKSSFIRLSASTVTTTNMDESFRIITKSKDSSCLLTVDQNVSCPDGLLSQVITGFNLAVSNGPLCSEPIYGVNFRILELSSLSTESSSSGQMISTSRHAFHRAFLCWSPRLMLAMYSCDIQATSQVLGKVYSIISKRQGKVISEDYNDGTGFFTIHSLLPIIESFGFANDIRSKTSGIAIPQLVFHGFEIFDEDPFWLPRTEEELEDFGQHAERANQALKYIMSIREKKGLYVERKLVQCAEKQRTLKK